MPRAPNDPSLDPQRSPIADRGTISDTGDVAAGAPATPPLVFATTDLTGTTIDRYRVLGRLGAGGMGVVYAAFDPALDRKVALKMLPQLAIEHHAALEARSRLEARLRREAQALAKLDHPNVIGVFDVGLTADNVFVTMQLIEGTTLDDYIRNTRPSPRQILELYVAAGRGLAAAHQAGLIHRDVKPSNILVDRTGHAYIGDFGLARGVDELDPANSMPRNLLHETMTQMGALLGTPRYMSPEQLGGEYATARSDQFSFCVSLWEALFGEHPFVAGTWTFEAAISAIATDRLREPGRVVSTRVVRALARGMRNDPAARWPSMAELLEEIRPRSRAGWVYAGGAVVGLGVAVSLTAVLTREPKADCTKAADPMTAVWPARRADIVAKHGERLAGMLDDYAERWQHARIETCEAGDGPQVDSASQCLDADLRIFGDIVGELIESKPGSVIKFGTVLPRLESCSVAAQTSMPPIPEAAVAKVAEVRLQIARGYRLRAEGNLARAFQLVDQAVTSSRAINYPPLLAEALVQRADLQLLTDDPAAGATAAEAAEVATGAFYDQVASRAYVIGLLAAANSADTTRLDALLRVARPTALRTKDPLSIAEFDHAGARAYRALGRFDEAEQACKDALDQATKLDDARRSQISEDAYGCYAETFAQRGNGPAALEWVDKWIDLAGQRYGKDRLGTLPAQRTKLTVLQLLHDTEGALAQSRKVLAISTASFGGDHISMLDDLFVHARLLRTSGRIPGALTAARRALALVEGASDQTPRIRVIAEETLAETLGMSDDRKGMYEHYETALAIAERELTDNDDHLATIRYSLGLALSHDDQLDRAGVLLGKATSSWQHLRSAKQYYAEVELGMVRAAQGRCTDAMPMFSHVIAGAPPGVPRLRAQGGLGACRAATGDKAGARKLFETIVREGATVQGGADFVAAAKGWLDSNP